MVLGGTVMHSVMPLVNSTEQHSKKMTTIAWARALDVQRAPPEYHHMWGVN